MAAPRDFEISRFAQDVRLQRRRSVRRWVVAGTLLGAVLGTLWAAPASWLAGVVASASEGRLLLAEARGSLWDGSALPVLTGGSGSQDAATLVDRLRWTLRPGWRGLQLRLHQDCCLDGDLVLRLTPGLSGLTLSLHDASAGEPPSPATAAAAAPVAAANGRPAGAVRLLGHWPAAWLAGLGAPFNTLAIGGTLTLSSPGFEVQSVQGRLRLAGQLSAGLRDASSRLSPLPVLGSYRLDVQGVAGGGDNALLSLRTESGALQLDGNGQWSGGRLRLRGQAQAAPGQEAALANLLSLIGRRQGAVSVLSIG